MKISTYKTSEKGGALIVKLGRSITDLVRIKYSVYHMKPFHFRSKSAGVGFVSLRRQLISGLFFGFADGHYLR